MSYQMILGRIQMFNSVVSRKRRTKLISIVAGVVLGLVVCGTQLEAQVNAVANFGLFLDTVQRVYCIPNGFTLERMRRERPTDMAIIFGHALRQQVKYVNQNQNLNPLFVSLQKQIRNYFDESVRKYGNSLIYCGQSCGQYGGPRVTLETLWRHFNLELQGQLTGMIAGKYHVGPGTMPFALAPSSPSSITGPQNLPLEQETEPPIDLLGVKPQTGVEKREPDPGPAKPSASVRPDAILGTWYSCGDHGCAQLEVRPEGLDSQGKQRFVGIIVNNQGDTGLCNWPRPDPKRGPVPAFHVTFDRVEPNNWGPPRDVHYVGKHLTRHGASAQFQEWQQLEFYYRGGVDPAHTMLDVGYACSFKRNPYSR